MRTAFLCNLSQRWRKREESIFRELRSFLEEHDRIFIVDKERERSTEAILGHIAGGKFDRIVVVAGDGTLNRAINALAARGCLERQELGIVPLGTCNDFARYMGLKKGDVRGALRVLKAGTLRRVRTGVVNGHLFLNNAGFGKRISAGEKKGAFQTLREMRPVTLDVQWDGCATRGSFLMMLCANAPYFSGGLRFSKKSDPSDGILEFYFLKNLSKPNLFSRLLLGRARMPLYFPVLGRSIAAFKGGRLSLRSDVPLWIVADGDPVAKLSGVRRASFSVGPSLAMVFPAR